MSSSPRVLLILVLASLMSYSGVASGQSQNVSNCGTNQNQPCVNGVVESSESTTPLVSPTPPWVKFRDGRLTIVAVNSSLVDILKAVSAQTRATLDLPAGDLSERVVVRLGPGPTREVLAELLNGTRFNYVMLGSPSDPNLLQRIVLTSRGETLGSAVVATSAPATGAEPGGPVLYGQGFSVDPNDPENGSEVQTADPAGNSPEAWSQKQGAALDQLQKQQIKQLEQQQQQQPPPEQE
jgi:hypothetical protein